MHMFIGIFVNQRWIRHGRTDTVDYANSSVLGGLIFGRMWLFLNADIVINRTSLVIKYFYLRGHVLVDVDWNTLYRSTAEYQNVYY